jgi:hypothetical protein
MTYFQLPTSIFNSIQKGCLLMPNATASNAITEVLSGGEQSKSLSLEIGARVEILQHKVLRCSQFGFVRQIDGAYNYVLPEALQNGEPAPEDCIFELYPNELRVVAVYRHPDFSAGTRVRIVAPLNWGRRKPREFAHVLGVSATQVLIQPIGPRKGPIMAAPVEALVASS